MSHTAIKGRKGEEGGVGGRAALVMKLFDPPNNRYAYWGPASQNMAKHCSLMGVKRVIFVFFSLSLCFCMTTFFFFLIFFFPPPWRSQLCFPTLWEAQGREQQGVLRHCRGEDGCQGKMAATGRALACWWCLIFIWPSFTKYFTWGEKVLFCCLLSLSSHLLPQRPLWRVRSAVSHGRLSSCSKWQCRQVSWASRGRGVSRQEQSPRLRNVPKPSLFETQLRQIPIGVLFSRKYFSN